MTRLYRSRRDCWVTGLLGGLGEYFNFSVTALRVLFLISVFVSASTTIFIYLIASLVVPKEPPIPRGPYYGDGWQGGSNGHYGYGASDSYHDPRFGGSQYAGTSHSGSQHGSPQYGGTASERNGSTTAYGETSFGDNGSHLDAMMEDLEKKAMKKELEELRKKLSKYETEKGD